MDAELSVRMKSYESQFTSQKLLPRVPACARIDGRAFHTFCHGLPRPYDKRLSDLMVETTQYLVENSQANCGYTQSDEISLVWHRVDFKSTIFFNGRVNKMNSILASMATAYFNSRIAEMIPERAGVFGLFDARVWNVPLEEEVVNYFMWREQDATRNSISMAAQAHFTQSELFKKNASEMQEMLFSQKDINWNNYPDFFKRGTYVKPQIIERPFSAEDIENLPPKHAARSNPNLVIKRQFVGRIEMPRLSTVLNAVNVILGDESPKTFGGN